MTTPAYSFTTAPNPVLPSSRASVFFDGTTGDRRLLHPECVAIGPDGATWTGSELGQIMRIERDGSGISEIASTGGFILGIAFAGDRYLFACDMQYAAVFRLDLSTRKLERFTEPGIRIPNFPAVDAARRRLLVSDSHASGSPGPGLWAYDLESGKGRLLTDRAFDFANGMALTEGGGALLVCETFSRLVTRVGFDAAGEITDIAPFAIDLPGLPDGLAVDAAGNVYAGCYEPSRVLRISPDGKTVEVYIEDPTAHLLAHPTNLAFDGPSLFTANLGRWHVTRIETDTTAEPLWKSTGL